MKKNGALWLQVGVVILVALGLGITFLPSGPQTDAGSPMAGEGPAVPFYLNFELAKKEATKDGKPIFIFFHTGWCGYCRQMERTTLRDPNVILAAKDIVGVRLDADAEKSLASMYGADGYPFLVLLNSKGEAIATHAGYLGAGQMIQFLAKAKS